MAESILHSVRVHLGEEIMSLIGRIFLDSKGLKRAIGTVLVFTGNNVAPVVPALMPFSELFVNVGLVFLGTGVVHAAVKAEGK